MPIDNFTITSTSGSINIKQSISNPIVTDVGNRTIQGRIVSKTTQYPYFTNNQNAVWAARRDLQKASYPYAEIDVSVNREHFRLEVGDVFKFTDTQLGISNLVCRLATIREADAESEKITITAIEDIFASAHAVTEYTAPINHAIAAPSYDIDALAYELVREAPYAGVGENLKILAVAARKLPKDIGFYLYMSIDDGASYFLLQQLTNLVPFGFLVGSYSADTFTIDTDGLIIDFETDVNRVEDHTLPDILSSIANLGFLGTEIISFQDITPISGTQYRLSTVIRGRYGTQRMVHADGERLFVIPSSVVAVEHQEVVVGAARKFKLVPYNKFYTGNITNSLVNALTIDGLVYTPYAPTNFYANGVNFAARYTANIVLTWSARVRGGGAGIGTPGTVLPATAYEGLYRIKVYVNDILVRTVESIAALTWTYTSAMNNSDNGALADDVVFVITNYIDGFESDSATVMCGKR